MIKVREIFLVSVIALLFQSVPLGQSGGTYAIEKSVIASSGGASSGGNLLLESTVGQAAAGGPASAGQYTIFMGFLVPGLMVPTAAPATVSGRVSSTDGRGLRGAVVTLTDAGGMTRTARTVTFGYYRFAEVAAGETYVVAVRSKRYRFEPRLINVTEDLSGVDFYPEASRHELLGDASAPSIQVRKID